MWLDQFSAISFIMLFLYVMYTHCRNQAVMIGQGLLESGWLEPVPNTRDGGAVFKDEYVLYQPGVVSPESSTAGWILKKIVVWKARWPSGYLIAF